jgi:hypothetical protein
MALHGKKTVKTVPFTSCHCYPWLKTGGGESAPTKFAHSAHDFNRGYERKSLNKNHFNGFRMGLLQKSWQKKSRPPGGFQHQKLNLFYRIHHSGKSLGVVHGEVGQYLAVEVNPVLGEFAHKYGVAHAMHAGTGIDTLNPQGAERAATGTAVAVSVGPAFFELVFSYRPHIFFAAKISFGHFHHALALCAGSDGVY